MAGGWQIGDAVWYLRGCHTEEAILRVAQGDFAPEVEAECFSLRQPLAAVLVRFVAAVPREESIVYVWEVRDEARETEYVISGRRPERTGDEFAI